VTRIGHKGQEDKVRADESAFFFTGEGRVNVTHSSRIAPGIHSFEEVARAHGWLPPVVVKPARTTLRSCLEAIARRMGLYEELGT